MIKSCRTENYNWDFNTVTGYFQRWGKTQEDDPQFSTLGPEILDLEISTICHGTEHGPCNFCYKSNTPKGKLMSLEKFKTILDKMPSNLTQIAFGIGDIDSHPQFEQMLQMTRDKQIVPNITINGYDCDDYTYSLLCDYMGSIAVSRYNDDVCFNTIKKLTDIGHKQVNIHQLLSADTYQNCLDLIDKIKTDPRLVKLNAIVFLMLKPKGRAKQLRNLTLDQFKTVITKAIHSNISFGLDSCSAPSLFKITKDYPQYPVFSYFIEPCEAFLFSSYCNVDGEFFPCSFCEGEPGWEKGIPVNENTDFIKGVWNHPKMIEWRERLLTSTSNCVCDLSYICRACPIHQAVTLCR